MPNGSRRRPTGNDTWNPADVKEWSDLDRLLTAPHARSDNPERHKTHRQNLRKAFGRRLESLIASAGMNQAEFARKVGLERYHITDYVTARRFPRPDNLDAMARALGVTSDFLRSGVSPAEPAAPPAGESFWMVADEAEPGKSRLHVNCVTSTPLAKQIIAMLVTGSDEAINGS